MDYSKKILNIEDLTFERLLKIANEEYMYSIYLGYYPETKKMYKSPFNDEKTPSFNFYYKDNKLKFKDYSSNNSGTIVDLVMILYSLDYFQALIKLNNDLNEKSYYRLPSRIWARNIINTNNINNKISIILKSYTQEDFDYWKEYYLDINNLEYFNIKPCQEVWLGNNLVYSYNPKNPCYRYVFNGKYKIYKPLDPKSRWLSNCNNIENIQGFEYLDYKSDILIITKSFKDVACLKQHLNYDSISFHGESHYIQEKIINYLKNRYQKIYFFYDNDIPGINNAKKLSELYNIPYIYIPEEYKVKDISDYIKNYGIHSAKQIVKLLIN